MKNTREINAENLLHFLSAWFKSNNVKLDIDKTINLTSLIIECFQDKTMFDSWFLGLDVMN